VFGAVAVLRLAELLAIGVLILASRRAWRLPRRLVPAVIGVAALDTAGNVFYILATQTGRLDIAATTSSLYPVVTLVLAVALLGERVSRPHAFGVVTAVVSIVLITMGTGPLARRRIAWTRNREGAADERIPTRVPAAARAGLVRRGHVCPRRRRGPGSVPG
jgi:drug/metabolite transporter (DMT)-like permease